MVSCCREARRTENLNLAQELMKQLTLAQPEGSTSPLALRIARESAKQIYCTEDTDTALEQMICVSVNDTENVKDKETRALIAR